jgi:hypothetical protein
LKCYKNVQQENAEEEASEEASKEEHDEASKTDEAAEASVEEEAEAIVEDDTEMEAEEDEDNGVVQEATIMGGTENNGSSTDKSEESDDDSDYEEDTKQPRVAGKTLRPDIFDSDSNSSDSSDSSVENTYKGEGVQGGPKAGPTEDLFVTPTKNTDTRRLIISLKPPEQPAIELDEDSTGTMPPAEETESDEAELEEASEKNWDSDWTNLGVKKKVKGKIIKKVQGQPTKPHRAPGALIDDPPEKFAKRAIYWFLKKRPH